MVFLYMAPDGKNKRLRGHAGDDADCRRPRFADFLKRSVTCESFSFALVWRPIAQPESPMAQLTQNTEEHELPSIEAVLAGTLALMTGYSQALQAEHDPAQRLRMGEKIGTNLSLLVDHPLLSLGFRQVLLGLQGRWQAMSECTALAARDCECDCDSPVTLPGAPPTAAAAFHMPAPKRLQ